MAAGAHIATRGARAVHAEPAGVLLSEIESYYDAVPHTAARVEHLGPFTLFIHRNPRGLPYYACPSLGAVAFEAEDVRRVRARQRELGIPETFEWVAETSPVLASAAEAAGLAVSRHPLMVLRQPPIDRRSQRLSARSRPASQLRRPTVSNAHDP